MYLQKKKKQQKTCTFQYDVTGSRVNFDTFQFDVDQSCVDKQSGNDPGWNRRPIHWTSEKLYALSDVIYTVSHG